MEQKGSSHSVSGCIVCAGAVEQLVPLPLKSFQFTFLTTWFQTKPLVAVVQGKRLVRHGDRRSVSPWLDLSFACSPFLCVSGFFLGSSAYFHIPKTYMWGELETLDCPQMFVYVRANGCLSHWGSALIWQLFLAVNLDFFFSWKVLVDNTEAPLYYQRKVEILTDNDKAYRNVNQPFVDVFSEISVKNCTECIAWIFFSVCFFLSISQ